MAGLYNSKSLVEAPEGRFAHSAREHHTAGRAREHHVGITERAVVQKSFGALLSMYHCTKCKVITQTLVHSTITLDFTDYGR